MNASTLELTTMLLPWYMHQLLSWRQYSYLDLRIKSRVDKDHFTLIYATTLELTKFSIPWSMPQLSSWRRYFYLNLHINSWVDDDHFTLINISNLELTTTSLPWYMHLISSWQWFVFLSWFRCFFYISTCSCSISVPRWIKFGSILLNYLSKILY